MTKLSTPFIQKTTWKTATVCTVLFVVLFALINYSSIGVAGLLNITGGANILDFELGYTHEKAYQMLTALGNEGRAFYQTKILPLDFPFPLAYMLCFASWIAFLLKRIPQNKRYTPLLLIPVIAAASDWIENIGILSMLRSYPTLPPWAVTTASYVGILKMFSIGASMAAIGILLFIRGKIPRGE